LLKKSGKYDYAIDKLDDKECIISFFKVTEKENILIGKSSFTFADAAKAGLVNKDNWKNYPRNCLFARALANGIRWYAPDYTPNAAGSYVIEEMDDLDSKKESIIAIDVEGEVKTNGETTV
jgi:hypothetical protein